MAQEIPYHYQFPRIIDASMREDWALCRRRWFYKHCRGLITKSDSYQPSEHLIAGGAYAAGLEVYRTEIARGTDFIEAGARGFVELTRAYGPTDFLTSNKSYDRTVAAYIEHLYRYPPDKEPFQTSLGPDQNPRVEYSFAIDTRMQHPDHTGETILYCGRVDQLVEWQGLLFTFDDKTTTSFGMNWSKKWELRSQFTGYIAGLREHGLEVAGAIVRGVAMLKTRIEIQDALSYRPDWLVDRWKQRMLRDVHYFVSAYQYWIKSQKTDLSTNFAFPHTGEENGACFQFSPCAYLPLCGNHPDAHETTVKEIYNVGYWNPSTRTIDPPEQRK